MRNESAERRAGEAAGELAATPIAWGLLALPAVAQLLLHLFTSGRFGIFRDEYYYLACAQRPAWGYVDHPALSIWFLSVWTTLFGDSLHSIRIPPALCGSALVLLAGATAAQLGGRRWAQLLAGLAVAVGGGTLVVSGFYSMNCFDLLFWLGAYFLLIRVARTGDGRGWLWFGVVVGLGLFNKIGLLVIGAALLVALALTRLRRHFADWRLHAGGAIALAFLSPYVLWNAANGWATREFIDNAQSGKIAAFTPWEFLFENILGANPLTLPVWVGGLAWLLLAPGARRFRVVALVFVGTYVILVLQNSKPYYFAASFPVLMAAGGVAWERWTSARRWSWCRGVLVLILVAGGALIAPMTVPLLSPEKTLAYGQKTGLMPAPQETGHGTPLPQYFSDRFGWENLARVVSEIYQNLSDEDREHCVVVGQNYGQAGALEYWSREYPLPPVYSGHNNYWLWGPPPEDTQLMIVIGGDPRGLREAFLEVEEVGVAETAGAIESSMPVWFARGQRMAIAEWWRSRKGFV